MTLTEDTRLRGATRWSMAARCPRQAVYAFQGVEPRDPDDETRLRFERGKLDEQWVVDSILVPRYGRDNLILQKPVPWPAPPQLPVGELHTDVFVTPRALDARALEATGGNGLPIEIKSHFSGDPSDSDFRQLRGQIHHDPDAGGAGVLILVDRDLHRDELPVRLLDEHAAEIDAITAAVVAGTRGGELPDRVCAKPTDGIGCLCPFIRHCFDGWEPDASVPPLDLEEFADAAGAAFDAKQKRDTAKFAAEAADAAWREKAAALAELDPPTGKSTVAGLEISRSPRKGSTTFSLAKARAAGMWTAGDAERLGAFVNIGQPYDVWDVKRVSAPSAEDFGEEAPF